jgi:hypothetical protein
MLRILLFGAILTTTGCQSSRGDLLYRQPGRSDDPRFSIAEQERRGRARLGVIEDDSRIGPKVFVDRPDSSLNPNYP